MRVFLCHSNTDKPRVRDLYRRLRADGFEPWLDEQDLLPGQNWRDEIPKAIHSCAAVIICLSQASIAKEGYLQREIRDALDIAGEKPEGAIFLIPLKLEECDLPQRLSQLHWASLAETGGYEKLVLALRKCAEAQGRPAQSAPSPNQSRIEGHLFCAERFVEQGEYAQAIEEFEKVLEVDGSNVDALRGIVRAARERLTLKAFPPSDPSVNIGLRKDFSNFAYVSTSEINAALKYVYALQARDPSLRADAALLLDEAMLLKTNGSRIGEAVKVLEKAHRLAPENSDINAELGLLLAVPEESQRKAEGIALVRRAVESQPAEARYHFYLARGLSDAHLCWAAGIEGTREGEPQACAEAIREFRRAADLAKGTDVWSRAIRIWANRQAMDIFHRYARKEEDILTAKLDMPLAERIKEIERLIGVGASTCQTGWEDNPKFWLPQLHFALGDFDAADRQIRDLLQANHSRESREGNYWEDESWVRDNRIYCRFFAKVLRETGRDPDILRTIDRLLPAED